MKIPVNLENYPALLELANQDKEKFLQLFKSTFTTLDRAAQLKHIEASETFFGMSYNRFMAEVMDAFFDHAGIMKFHPNMSIGASLSDLYEHAVNPLHAAFMETDLLNAAGDMVSYEEKFGLKEEELNVKSWLHGLMFYSFYCSLPDLAKYLSLNDYDLVDEEKHKNVGKLLQVKPALAYQKQIGILPGKLIPRTGFFDCGDYHGGEDCISCQLPNTLHEHKIEEIMFCDYCFAGFKQ